MEVSYEELANNHTLSCDVLAMMGCGCPPEFAESMNRWHQQRLRRFIYSPHNSKFQINITQFEVFSNIIQFICQIGCALAYATTCLIRFFWNWRVHHYIALTQGYQLFWKQPSHQWCLLCCQVFCDDRCWQYHQTTVMRAFEWVNKVKTVLRTYGSVFQIASNTFRL